MKGWLLTVKESKIKDKVSDRQLSSMKLKQAEKALDSIEKKKNEIVEAQDLTDEEKESYWNS